MLLSCLGACGGPHTGARAPRTSGEANAAQRSREDALIRAREAASGKERAAAERALERFRFAAAARRDTVFAWRRFLGLHPGGLLAERARRRLARARYRALGRNPGAWALARFLSEHGDVPLARRVWTRYLERQAAVLAARGDVQAIERYLRAHPNSPARARLRARLEALLFAQVRRHPTRRALLAFQARFPASAHRRTILRWIRWRALAQAYFFGASRDLLQALRDADPWLAPAVRRQVRLRVLGLALLEAHQGAVTPRQIAALVERLAGSEARSVRRARAARANGRAKANAGGTGDPWPAVRHWIERLAARPGVLSQVAAACAATAAGRLPERLRTLRAALRGSSLDLAAYALWRLRQERSRSALNALLDGLRAPHPLTSLHAALALLDGWRRAIRRAPRPAPALADWTRSRAAVALVQDTRDRAATCRPCGVTDRIRALALDVLLRLGRRTEPRPALSVRGRRRADAELRSRRWPPPWTAVGRLLSWLDAALPRPAGGGARATERQADSAAAARWRRSLLESLQVQLRRLRAALPAAGVGAGEPRRQQTASGRAALVSLVLLRQAVDRVRRLNTDVGGGALGRAWDRLARQCSTLADEVKQRLGVHAPDGAIGLAAARQQERRWARSRGGRLRELEHLLKSTRAPAWVWAAVCSLGSGHPRCDRTFTRP